MSMKYDSTPNLDERFPNPPDSKRDHKPARGAGSELACSEWMDELREMLQHALFAERALRKNRLLTVDQKLREIIFGLRAITEQESSSIRGDMARLPAQRNSRKDT